MLLVAQGNLTNDTLRRKTGYDPHGKISNYHVDQKVLLRTHFVSDTFKKLTKKFFHIYAGPYDIVAVHDNNTLELHDAVNNVYKGRHNERNVKPYLSKEDLLEVNP